MRLVPRSAPRAVAALLAAGWLGAASAADGAPLKPAPSRAGLEPPVETAAPDEAKLDPALRWLIARWSATQRLAAGPARESAQRSLLDPAQCFHLRRDEADGEPTASTFVRVTDPAAAAALESEGARVRTTVGNIAVVQIPVSRLRAVARRPEVLSLELAGISQTWLDSSRVRSKVKDVHNGLGGLDRPYQGAGVVVGVLDSGLDYTHPDFKTGGGVTRLKGLFDFSFGAGGREWSIGSLDSATSTEYDGHLSGGHGTHVTGTAAGGGRFNASYIGMAPQADILFVKGMRDTASGSGFDDADVVAGTQWIFDKARALGEPCVVNLSLGSQFGAHDGTSLQEQALDGLTHPGNIIVAAAGNAGAAFIHGGYAVPPGASYVDAFETLFQAVPGVSQSVVDLWYPAGGSINVGVAVYAPGSYNTPLVNMTTGVGPGGTVSSLLMTDGATNYGIVDIDASTIADLNNGKHRVLVGVRDASGTHVSDFHWSVFTYGSGSFDMWLVTSGQFAPPIGGLPAYFVPGDNTRSVGIPATAKKLIAVGSYVTKTQWVDKNGVTRTQFGAVLDQMSTFSSMGPSADGRSLPNLVAPGEAILAPLAVSAAPFTPASDILQGGGYLKLQGTSMASPHVTGVVALMLERNRFLTPENARTLLQGAATPPGSPDPNLWGAGRLNALGALLATPAAITCGAPAPFGARSADCPESEALEPGVLRVRPNPAARAATFAFRLGVPERVDLAVYDLAGRRVRTLGSGPMTAGPHELVWDGARDDGIPVSSGVYFGRLRTPSRTALQRLVVIK